MCGKAFPQGKPRALPRHSNQPSGNLKLKTQPGQVDDLPRFVFYQPLTRFSMLERADFMVLYTSWLTRLMWPFS